MSRTTIKFILAKLCPTSPGMLKRFGECNTITWYQIKPNDELMDQDCVIKISNHEEKDLGPDLALLIPTPLEDRQGPLPFLWQTEPHPAPSAPHLTDEMADEARRLTSTTVSTRVGNLAGSFSGLPISKPVERLVKPFIEKAVDKLTGKPTVPGATEQALRHAPTRTSATATSTPMRRS